VFFNLSADIGMEDLVPSLHLILEVPPLLLYLIHSSVYSWHYILQIYDPRYYPKSPSTLYLFVYSKDNQNSFRENLNPYALFYEQPDQAFNR
jgi:hypothetical protein